MLVRYKGVWYKITPKAGEPERMTEELVWMKLKEEGGAREWYKKERKVSRVLYNERPT